MLGRYNLACLFLFKAQTQIINIVTLERILIVRHFSAFGTL